MRLLLFAMALLLVSCGSAKYVEGRYSDKVVLNLGPNWNWSESGSDRVQPLLRGKDEEEKFELEVYEFETNLTDDQIMERSATWWRAGAKAGTTLGADWAQDRKIYSQLLSSNSEKSVQQLLIVRRAKSTFSVVVRPGPTANPEKFNAEAEALLKKVEVGGRRGLNVSG